jgi:hypothetical protein
LVILLAQGVPLRAEISQRLIGSNLGVANGIGGFAGQFVNFRVQLGHLLVHGRQKFIPGLKPAPSIGQAVGLASTLEALVDELLHSFLGIPGALLNASNQFVFTAFFVAQVVVGQLCVLLFQFSFGDIPIALDVKCVHIDIPYFVDWLFDPICSDGLMPKSV